MKKLFIISILFSLAGNSFALANPEGKVLIDKSDCLTCHKIDAKLIGPSYQEVAIKYKDQKEAVDVLAEKIIKGGSGVWGRVPMLAHSTLSQEDAKKIVEWILTQTQ